jgi:hypothetical protein
VGLRGAEEHECVVSYHRRFLRIRRRRSSNVGIGVIVDSEWASWRGFATVSVGPRQGRSGQGGARPIRWSGRDSNGSRLIHCCGWGGVGWKERGRV